MAKKKDSVALFEVIAKGKQRHVDSTLDVPGWMGPADQRAAAPAGSYRPVAAAPAAPARRPVRTVPGRPEPLLSFTGDRMRLSLNYVSSVVAVLGLLVLLVGAFALGWWGGAQGGRAAEAGSPDGVPYRPDVLGGSGRTTPTPPAPGTSQRQDGKWYLVIQGLAGTGPDDFAEAGRIVAFCRQQGEPATVALYTRPRGRKRYIVWSLTPFDSRSGSKVLEHARAIEEMGKRYRQAGGKYNFQQRSAPGAELDPWFEVYHAPSR